MARTHEQTTDQYRVAEWVARCREAPAGALLTPAQSFEAAARTMHQAGYALPPHIARAIRAALQSA